MLASTPIYGRAKWLAEVAFGALSANKVAVCGVAGAYKDLFRAPRGCEVLKRVVASMVKVRDGAVDGVEMLRAGISREFREFIGCFCRVGACDNGGIELRADFLAYSSFLAGVDWLSSGWNPLSESGVNVRG